MNKLAVGRSARAQRAHKLINRINQLIPVGTCPFKVINTHLVPLTQAYHNIMSLISSCGSWLFVKRGTDEVKQVMTWEMTLGTEDSSNTECWHCFNGEIRGTHPPPKKKKKKKKKMGGVRNSSHILQCTTRP